MQVRSLARIIYTDIRQSGHRPCDQFWLLDWYPNYADPNLPRDAVGIFLTLLLR
jgi:hypothetical protein